MLPLRLSETRSNVQINQNRRKKYTKSVPLNNPLIHDDDDDDSDYLADSSVRSSPGLEPLDFSDEDFEPNRGRYPLLRSWIIPPRGSSFLERQRYRTMGWLTGSFGRRPRLSRLLYCFALYFLVFLYVLPIIPMI